LVRTYQMGNDKVNALRNINLSVLPGDFIALMGASGSGKSTLMHLLGCLDRPTSGEYWLEGQNISSLRSDNLADIRGRRIGFIFQSFNLLPKLTALENVALPLAYCNKKIKTKNQRTQATDALSRVGLSQRASHLPTELSGGERQRVAIARALVTHPAVILADEPTGNLDSANGNEILQLLIDLNSEGVTIVMVTHDQKIANLANRICTMQDGKIIDERGKYVTH
jgi:putative ABC transport system ATP-binding protein